MKFVTQCYENLKLFMFMLVFENLTNITEFAVQRFTEFEGCCDWVSYVASYL